MDWRTFVCQWEGPRLVELIGAPRRTVYSWRDGSSSPPDWCQPILREYIVRKAREGDAAMLLGHACESRWAKESENGQERHADSGV